MTKKNQKTEITENIVLQNGVFQNVLFAQTLDGLSDLKKINGFFIIQLKRFKKLYNENRETFFDAQKEVAEKMGIEVDERGMLIIGDKEKAFTEAMKPIWDATFEIPMPKIIYFDALEFSEKMQTAMDGVFDFTEWEAQQEKKEAEKREKKGKKK